MSERVTPELRAEQPSSATIRTTGPAHDTDAWTSEGWGSVEQALQRVGTRSAMRLMREAFLGTRRFDELARRSDLSNALAATRLKDLVEGGLLSRQPYREPGARTRYEYVMTEQGRSLFPILVGLLPWGDTFESDETTTIELVHDGCGKRLNVVVECEDG